MERDRGQITSLLNEWGNGDENAFEELMPLVYSDLRKRASIQLRNEKPNHTLQATALINEAYINLVGKNIAWESRSHFFAIASKAMRRILVDHAKAKNRKKRGGGSSPVSLDTAATILIVDQPGTDLVALDEALLELAEFDERQAQVVELKFFAGFSNEEAAKILGVSNVTVRRDWKMAKAWLYEELSNRGSGE